MTSGDSSPLRTPLSDSISADSNSADSMLAGPILAIETSCDETAAAVLSLDGVLLSNVVHSQVEIHAPYLGVVPEIASREHVVRIGRISERALSDAAVHASDVGGVAVTYGPGLIGALLVGVQFAKAFARARSIPLLPVHHLEGHLAAASLDENGPKPPFIGLIASGGHSATYAYRGPRDVELLGETRDDAAGEAFDKTAKLLGLGYPGGRAVDELANQGDANRFPLPVSFSSRSSLEYSFSGVKTAVRLLVERHQAAGTAVDGQLLADVCACLRKAIVDALLQKAFLACEKTGINQLVLGGGVAANSLLRREAQRIGAERTITVYVPPHRLCTDNAAMIGMAALLQDRVHRRRHPSLKADANASLDETAVATATPATTNV